MAETSIVPVDDEGHEIIQDRQINVIEQRTRGEIDIQIATAKRFPRSFKKFMETAASMVTLSTEVAESCLYALPRGGKTIEGPSSRFAETIASAWGHLRAGSMVTDIGDQFITVQGFAWDLESNVAVHFEVRRRITDRQGRRFNEDMIGVTAAAAGSIAYRNAVLKVIPAAFWKPLWMQARKVAIGDAKTLIDRRTAALAELAKMGVREDRIFAALEVGGVEDIDLEKLAKLRAMFVAVRDENADIDSVFPDPKSKPNDAKPVQSMPAALADRLQAARDAAGVVVEQPPEPEKETPKADNFGAEIGSLMDTTPAPEPVRANRRTKA